ncbi:MAG: excinuclease ABC subunit UvrC [Betaproteobacteria bacterium]|nr:excinuclease ABC subunit UvrC [Betaproteobacteria bacterium]
MTVDCAAAGAAGNAEKPPAFDSAAFIANLPNLPGVYRMLSAAGDVLYVGKARDLKKRVSSYFQKTALSPRIVMMLSQTANVEITVTGSESEALILENNLIKSLAPRYNILFRDDKSYPYLMVSGGDFPRLGFHRGALEKSSRYFGPFPHSGAVRESIQLLQRVFRLRTCEDSVFNNRSRPCLLHQIRRCSAPCVGLIDRAAYAEDVSNARLFLEGRSDELIKALSERMRQAADALAFEQAAMLRDQIQSLSRMAQRQHADVGTDQDADVIAVASDHGLVCVNLVMIRGGRHLGDRSLFAQNAKDQPPGEILQAFIAQHYLERLVPPVIVTAQGSDAGEVERFLGEYAGHRIHVVVRPTGDRRAWFEMAEKNARQALKQRLSEQSTQEVRLGALRESLGLPDVTSRIECFDVSHTAGEATVASCVVYDRFDMRHAEYRRYNIGEVTPGDDFAAMKQVLSRRYSRVAGGEGVVPDLILIDGGKGQVSTAAGVLAELGLNDVALAGVAKGPERKPGLEELWIAGRAGPIHLAPDHAGLHLIQQIRDEAHRFAITGHRARRAKTRVTSTLEGIGGIGAKRRRELLARFGGLKGVMGASIEDLAQVAGISRRLAEKIYRELHAA